MQVYVIHGKNKFAWKDPSRESQTAKILNCESLHFFPWSKKYGWGTTSSGLALQILSCTGWAESKYNIKHKIRINLNIYTRDKEWIW